MKHLFIFILPLFVISVACSNALNGKFMDTQKSKSQSILSCDGQQEISKENKNQIIKFERYHSYITPLLGFLTVGTILLIPPYAYATMYMINAFNLGCWTFSWWSHKRNYCNNVAPAIVPRTIRHIYRINVLYSCLLLFIPIVAAICSNNFPWGNHFYTIGAVIIGISSLVKLVIEVKNYRWKKKIEIEHEKRIKCIKSGHINHQNEERSDDFIADVLNSS